MKTLVLLFKSNNLAELIKIEAALKDIHKYEHNEDSLLIYCQDFNMHPNDLNKIAQLWPIRLNLFRTGSKTPYADAAPMLAHLAIKLNADVYRIGEPTGMEEFFQQMRIEVTKMPVE